MIYHVGGVYWLHTMISMQPLARGGVGAIGRAARVGTQCPNFGGHWRIHCGFSVTNVMDEVCEMIR